MDNSRDTSSAGSSGSSIVHVTSCELPPVQSSPPFGEVTVTEGAVTNGPRKNAVIVAGARHMIGWGCAPPSGQEEKSYRSAPRNWGDGVPIVWIDRSGHQNTAGAVKSVPFMTTVSPVGEVSSVSRNSAW